MTFIVALLALVIERFFHWNHFRQWRWFRHYQHWLARTRLSNQNSWILLLACVAPFVIMVGLVNALLTGWLYGILKLIFGLLILLYCFGPQNLWLQTFACLKDLHASDPKAAIEHAQAQFGLLPPENSSAFHRALTNAIFIGANQRIFAVVFWFVILGPLGAVLYRTVSLCKDDSSLGLSQTATYVRQWLDWIPVRILSFLFALGGHFSEVFVIWKRYVRKGPSQNDLLITESGVAALDVLEDNRFPEEGDAEKSALELLDRSFIIALVILAMIVMIMK